MIPAIWKELWSLSFVARWGSYMHNFYNGSKERSLYIRHGTSIEGSVFGPHEMHWMPRNEAVRLSSGYDLSSSSATGLA